MFNFICIRNQRLNHESVLNLKGHPMIYCMILRTIVFSGIFFYTTRIWISRLIQWCTFRPEAFSVNSWGTCQYFPPANLPLAGRFSKIRSTWFHLDDVWVPISQRTWHVSFLAERELQLMWYKLPLQCTSSSVGEYGNYGSQLYFP